MRLPLQLVPALSAAYRARRSAYWLAAAVLSALVVLATVGAHELAPVAWPAAGLLTGAALVADRDRRGGVLALGGALLTATFLLTGHDALPAVALGAGSALGSWLTLHRLQGRPDRSRPGLQDDGDVSRLIGAAAVGAGAAAVLTAATAALLGVGEPGLVLVAVWGTHAASQLILLPLLLKGPGFAGLAPPRERVVQSVITIGTTALIFGYADAPPLVFAVMPMFGWLAFRGTLREASVVLAGVGVVATVATALGWGPVQELAPRYGLPSELVTGFLQLFLIDCALILLPLSVMAAQQRTATAQARAREQVLQRLMDAATGTGVLAVDLDGVVTVFNPGAEATFGRPAGEVVGLRADRLFCDSELGRQAASLGARPVFAEICRAVVDGEQERRPWQLTSADGTERTVLLSITAIPDDHAGTAGYLCVADDVTEREAAHRSLVVALEHERAAVERLEDLERVKSDFVATISHELRTPLASMLGYVELLQDGLVGELASDQRSLVGRVERNGRRLLMLVEDLLLLSHIEARQMRVDPVPVDLREPVRGAVESVSPMLAGRDLDLRCSVPEDGVPGEADPDQMERLVVNLLTNAIKFTPDGGRLDVRLTACEETATIEVQDDGIGIPEDEQPRLFTRFYRSASATTQAVQGAGLGLTIVQAIATLHGGTVTVASESALGTTVTVTLPRRVPTREPAGQSATP